MSVSRDDVLAVAKLARLRFAPEEVDRFTRDLARIVDHVETLARLDLAAVEPTAHVLDLADAFRPDEPGTTLGREAIDLAPESEGDFFTVPRVLESR